MVKTVINAVIVETYGRPMVGILSDDEYLTYINYKAGQEQRAARFSLLREAAGQNVTYNQLLEEEGSQLVEKL